MLDLKYTRIQVPDHPDVLASCEVRQGKDFLVCWVWRPSAVGKGFPVSTAGEPRAPEWVYQYDKEHGQRAFLHAVVEGWKAFAYPALNEPE